MPADNTSAAIEAVARAIYERSPFGIYPAWDDSHVDESKRNDFRTSARAAIAEGEDHG